MTVARPRMQIFKRLAIVDTQQSASDSSVNSVIPMIFATPNVALDNNRILPGAWQSGSYDGLADFKNLGGPYMWAHDTSKPPVGKVVNLREEAGYLKGGVRFASYDFAQTIAQLYASGFMRGSSVSWVALDWAYATGPNRSPGAIDFKKVQLLEISAVPLPADMGALAEARAFDLGKPFTAFDDGRAERERHARMRLHCSFDEEEFQAYLERKRRAREHLDKLNVEKRKWGMR